MEKHGAFIVIDGTDGSGKATQTKLLVDRMQKEGYLIKTISFPQYGLKSAGSVEEYLSGKYGSALDVGPYRASIFYAVDRFDASQKIQTWIDFGTHVVADRYVGSNMGHQGSKIENDGEREKFFAWNDALEHELFAIPRPDINIILHVPVEISVKLMQKRERSGEEKHDLKQDIHQKDIAHLKAAEKTYLEIAKQFDTFTLIECTENNKLLSPEQIHERVWTLVSKYVTI